LKVIGVDGKTYNWAIYNSNPQKKPSSHHLRARQLLKTLHPFALISEELRIPSTKLSCDFYICSPKIMVEVHGEQHYSYVHHFHQNKIAFFKGQKRDKLKKEFCELNKIIYVELPHGENDEQWTERIRNAVAVE
jgi:hypothetical protein